MCMGENFKIEYGSRYVWDSSSKHTEKCMSLALALTSCCWIAFK